MAEKFVENNNNITTVITDEITKVIFNQSLGFMHVRNDSEETIRVSAVNAELTENADGVVTVSAGGTITLAASKIIFINGNCTVINSKSNVNPFSVAVKGGGAGSGFKTKFVDELPISGEENTIYFVPTAEQQVQSNRCDEYMWFEEQGWEKIGSTDIDLNEYLTVENPTGKGSLSINRKANTHIGVNSVAIGDNASATNVSSVAIGSKTTATGAGAVALGANGTASGDISFVEGNGNESKGNFSHAEGNNTIASGESQHTQGKFNLEDTQNKFAHIVGNGESASERSNAHTLDWDGNAWYAGDVKATDSKSKTISLIETNEALSQPITNAQTLTGEGTTMATVDNVARVDMVGGKSTAEWGVVDLGSLEWGNTGVTSDSGGKVYFTNLPNKAYGVTNIVSDKYVVDNVPAANMALNSIRGHATENYIYLCINEGDEKSGNLYYEPSAPEYAQLINVTPTSVETVGKNLVDESTFANRDIPIASGTVRRASYAPIYLESGTYYCTFSHITANVCYANNDSGNVQITIDKNTSFEITTDGIYYIRFADNAESLVTIHNFMLCRGSTATPYKPYCYSSLSLEALTSKYFPTGMKSAGTVYDELDLENKVAIQRVGSVDLGSLEWRDEYGYIISNISDMATSYDNLCSAVSQVSWNDFKTSNNCFYVENTKIYIKYSDISSASAMKSAMSGVILNYELTTPIITPITESIGPILDTVDGGTLTINVDNTVSGVPYKITEGYEYPIWRLVRQGTA